MVIGLGAKGGCDGPCEECGGPCAVCNDIAGDRSVLMTLPDIATQTDLDPGGTCPECEAYQAATELIAIDQASSISILSNFILAGCTPDADYDEGSVCGYVSEETCAGSGFGLVRFAATYRASGDLRMFVGLIFTNGGVTVYESDDFLLASGAYKFDCLGLDRDGTFTVCSGTPAVIGCTTPSAYNVQMIAA